MSHDGDHTQVINLRPHRRYRVLGVNPMSRKSVA
jgi:hypothetical protein